MNQSVLVAKLEARLAKALDRAARAETATKIAKLAKAEALRKLHVLKERVRLIDDNLAGGRFSGCYILFAGDSVVYVGQSINVFSRIASHRLPNSKPTKGQFTSVEVVWCDAADLDATERRLIAAHQPLLNCAGVSTNYTGFNAPLRKFKPNIGATMSATMTVGDSAT